MKFLMPTLVYSEENCVLNHSAELAALGSRALIVTGKRSARRCGAFADVTAALDKHGVSWVEFAEVEENPSVETVMRARQVGCKVKADFVIGNDSRNRLGSHCRLCPHETRHSCQGIYTS